MVIFLSTILIDAYETWSNHLIRQILDNPVYCGKIAYGRRTREKVKGTKNEYKQVHTDDYILEDGQHEGIVSEELWQEVHAKRLATGIKQPSRIGKERSHLLTGVLKCPPFVAVQCIRINTHGQIKTAHIRKSTIIYAEEISRSWGVIVTTRHL